jgi:MerR family mercuric resistance operon transcriptional regulator
MKISQAAEASGCHLETIRYYERIGLLPAPDRTGSGYRVDGSRDIERLRFIARGRDLGFSLEEIRSLLQLASNEGLCCVEVDRLARNHLADILTRLADLRRMASELERVIASCQGGQRAQCTILSTLRQRASSTKALAYRND